MKKPKSAANAPEKTESAPGRKGASMRSARGEQFIPTRRTLLERLRTWEDHESWRDFFDTYWKLIYGVALRAGLNANEAEDVVQETVLTAAKTMPKFRYDPNVCSFKGWLLHLTRKRIADQFKKRLPTALNSIHPLEDATERTPTVERIPDTSDLAFESVWEEEWRNRLLEMALEKVKRTANPKHYQIFYLHVIKKLPARDVAETLHTNIGQVYLTKHRLARMVRKEVKGFE